MTHVDLIEKLLQYENGTVLCGEFFLADFGLCVDTIRRSGGLRRLEMARETESDVFDWAKPGCDSGMRRA